jgi:hypothetical protein
MMVSDASTSVFTVNAGGLAKTVSVYALGFEAPEVPDLAIRQVLATLRKHLLDIDQGGTVKTDVYAPDRYRAILLDGQAGAPDQKAWPWPEVKPAEFVSNGDPNAMPLPARVMTAAEIETLGSSRSREVSSGCRWWVRETASSTASRFARSFPTTRARRRRARTAMRALGGSAGRSRTSNALAPLLYARLRLDALARRFSVRRVPSSRIRRPLHSDPPRN